MHHRGLALAPVPLPPTPSSHAVLSRHPLSCLARCPVCCSPILFNWNPPFSRTSTHPPIRHPPPRPVRHHCQPDMSQSAAFVSSCLRVVLASSFLSHVVVGCLIQAVCMHSSCGSGTAGVYSARVLEELWPGVSRVGSDGCAGGACFGFRFVNV